MELANEKQLREHVERLEETIKHRDTDIRILKEERDEARKDLAVCKTELEIKSRIADSLELDRDRVVGDLHLCEDRLTAMIELFIRVAQMLKQVERSIDGELLKHREE